MNLYTDLQAWMSQQTPLEIAGVITGLLCVYLAAKNNILSWPVAIISVCIYTVIFYKTYLFADMGLQIYFLIMNVYGWYFWSKRPANAPKAPIHFIKTNEVYIASVVIILSTLILGTILKHTTASLPYLDSFCTACSIVAQVLLARKIIENWLLWIFVDVIYVGVYIYKDLHLTAAMYTVYLAIATLGYIDWKKEWQQQKSTP